MSRERILRARENGKAFRKFDVIIYVLIIIIVAVLLCVFLIPTVEKSELEKIEIYFEENCVFDYEFSTKNVTIKDSCVTVTELNDGIAVTINTKKGKNVLFIGENYAKMTEADCSVYADCVNNFTEINSGGDVIVCLPHSLKVVGIGLESNEVIL